MLESNPIPIGEHSVIRKYGPNMVLTLLEISCKGRIFKKIEYPAKRSAKPLFVCSMPTRPPICNPLSERFIVANRDRGEPLRVSRTYPNCFGATPGAVSRHA